MKIPNLVFYNGANLLEGPAFDSENKNLYFVAIRQNIVFRLELSSGRIYSYDTVGPVGAAVPVNSHSVLVADKFGIFSLDPISGERKKFAQIITDNVMRYNDAKLDAAGRLLVDVMGDTERNSNGGLFSLESNGVYKELVSGTTVANGLGFSKNNEILYFIDTPTKKVKAYTYDLKTGNISDERNAVIIDGAGSPDGMCVDDDDMIWVAEFGGGCVRKWNPYTGEEIERINLPCKNVTSCCIGGTETKKLYITTAKSKGENEPLAGGLFSVDL